MIRMDFQNEIINLVEQIENDLGHLKGEKDLEKIKSVLLDNEKDIQRRFLIVQNLGHLIINAIKKCDRSKYKKKDLADEIKNYIDLMFIVIQEEDIADYILCELVFELGQIGCYQYNELFDTNNDLIIKKLVNAFKEEKNEIVKEVIANAFWHLAGVKQFPEKYKKVLRELRKNSKKTIKYYLEMALLSLGEKIAEEYQI